MSATVASRARCSTRSSGPTCRERTFYHGHSYSGNALAAAVALRHLAAARRVGRARQRARPRRRSCGRLLDERVAPLPAWREVRRCGPDGRRRAGAAAPTACAGAGGCRAACVRARRAAPPARRRGRAHAAAHHHRRARSSGSSTCSADAIDEVDASTVTAGRELGRRRERDRRSAHAGRWRALRDLDAAGPDGRARRRRPATVVSFASNDYLGLTQHPAVVAAAHDALDRWGAGLGRGPAHRRRPAGARASSRRSWPTGSGTRARRCSSPPGSPPTSACSPTFGAAGVRVVSATSSTTRRSSTAAAWPGPTSPSYPPRATSTTLRGAAGRARRAGRSSSPTPCSRWTATSRRVDELADVCAPPRRAARARRGPRRARPRPDRRRPRRRRRAAGRHAVEDARLARRLRRRPRAVRRPARQPGPPVHLHHRARPRPTRPPRWPPLARRALAPRATRCAATLRGARRARRARAPVADRPGRPRRRGRAPSARRPPCSTRGLLVPAIRPPTVARRHLAACASPCPPPTPTTRSTRSSPPSPIWVRPRRMRGTRARDG